MLLKANGADIKKEVAGTLYNSLLYKNFDSESPRANAFEKKWEKIFIVQFSNLITAEEARFDAYVNQAIDEAEANFIAANKQTGSAIRKHRDNLVKAFIHKMMSVPYLIDLAIPLPPNYFELMIDSNNKMLSYIGGGASLMSLPAMRTVVNTSAASLKWNMAKYKIVFFHKDDCNIGNVYNFLSGDRLSAISDGWITMDPTKPQVQLSRVIAVIVVPTTDVCIDLFSPSNKNSNGINCTVGGQFYEMRRVIPTLCAIWMIMDQDERERYDEVQTPAGRLPTNVAMKVFGRSVEYEGLQQTLNAIATRKLFPDNSLHAKKAAKALLKNQPKGVDFYDEFVKLCIAKKQIDAIDQELQDADMIRAIKVTTVLRIGKDIDNVAMVAATMDANMIIDDSIVHAAHAKEELRKAKAAKAKVPKANVLVRPAAKQANVFENSFKNFNL